MFVRIYTFVNLLKMYTALKDSIYMFLMKATHTHTHIDTQHHHQPNLNIPADYQPHNYDIKIVTQ